MEIFFYRHPRLYFMFLIKPADYYAVRLWRISIAYYNLTTAAALFIGAYLLETSHPDAGRALILFTACQHIFLAVVMLIVQPKLWLNTRDGSPPQRHPPDHLRSDLNHPFNLEWRRGLASAGSVRGCPTLMLLPVFMCSVL